MKAVIFDFDGTLADSFETLLDIFDEVSRRPEKLTVQEVRQLRGQTLREIIKYLQIKRWQLPRMILGAKRLISLRILEIKTFPVMPETLADLGKSGVDMYILSTNSSANIQAFLKQNQLDSYFKKIYGDIGLRSKASALRKIIKQEHLKPVDCFYVGDEVRDIEAAEKASITSVGVTWGFNSPAAIKRAQPAYIAHKPAGLLKILK